MHLAGTPYLALTTAKNQSQERAWLLQEHCKRRGERLAASTTEFRQVIEQLLQDTWDDLKLFVVINAMLLLLLALARAAIGDHDVWPNLCAPNALQLRHLVS